MQDGGELVEDSDPSIAEFIEVFWGQEGLFDGHECLIVAVLIEGDGVTSFRTKLRKLSLNCAFPVELRGFEPLTYSMRTSRATNCAIAPDR
jgi:hypothetical protein